MADLKRKKLAKKAEENTTIVKKVAKEEPEVIKNGTPVEHSQKHNILSNSTVVGMNKGITKNMDNYESLRVDVWLSDTVKDGETIEDCFKRVESIIDETLENAVSNTIGD